MKTSHIRLAVVATALAVAGGVTWAQGTAPPAPGAGTLAALTEEVHQLRLTLADSAKSQTQIQAMTVYLSAQQSRLGQISGRLDKAHADVVAASAETQAVGTRLSAAQTQVNQIADPAERTAFTQLMAGMKQQRDTALDRENQARARENEQLNAFQIEEARWLDLIARLEALVKR